MSALPRLVLLCLFGAACAREALPGAGVDLAAARPDAVAVDLAVADRAGPRDLTRAPDLLAICTLDAPNAAVDGATEIGPFHGRYAWLGYAGAECPVTPIITITATSPIIGAGPHDGMSFYVTPPPTGGSWLGDHAVTVVYRLSGKAPSAAGTVSLTRVDLPKQTPFTGDFRVTGTLNIKTPGWQLSGSFEARHCPLFDQYCV